MGKKKRSSGFISNNERPNVSKTTLKEMRREYLKSSERLSNQWDAFQRGKRVMVTIPNPSAKSETARPFIRVTAQEAGWKKQEPYKMKQEG